jgi:hypothetical protein
MPLRIYGAGMAGLLASTMLRRLRPSVHEAQAELPDNHGALLRFRTDAVERETGQPFKRVRVQKAVMSAGRLRASASLADANRYSQKVTGSVMGRSVMDLAPCERYIAPDTFLNTMARDIILRVSSPLTLEVLRDLKVAGSEVAAISTIPMPVLMKIVGWDNPGFEWRPIWSVTATVTSPTVDLYQTVYYPEPDTAWYRASFTGARLILEYAKDPGDDWADDLTRVLRDLGLDHAAITAEHPKRQEYGKLLPLPDAVRQEFILAMTDEYNLYSVGRFATWRQILLDDVVKDVRLVERWITQRNSYQRRLEHVRS